jgi:hypothetical protein
MRPRNCANALYLTSHVEHALLRYYNKNILFLVTLIITTVIYGNLILFIITFNIIFFILVQRCYNSYMHCRFVALVLCRCIIFLRYCNIILSVVGCIVHEYYFILNLDNIETVHDEFLRLLLINY